MKELVNLTKSKLILPEDLLLVMKHIPVFFDLTHVKATVMGPMWDIKRPHCANFDRGTQPVDNLHSDRR